MGRYDNNYKKILNFYFQNNEVDLPKDIIDKMVIELRTGGKSVFYFEKDDCKYYILKISTQYKSCEKVVKKIIEDFDSEKKAKFLLIVSNIQDKLDINTPQYKKDFKDELTRKLSLKKRINTIQDITAEFICNKSKDHNIEITNRVDSLHYLAETSETTETKCENKFEGYVYIASLYDVVNMYNSIGDSLFDLNVRYRISDELDVEKEIKRTLSEKPKSFWFNNNGITIITNIKDFDCNRPRTIKFSSNNNFSVINGAQTITTAAKWLSENNDKKDNLRDSWVILRVILVDDISRSFAKEVSVSLNRQKSISEVDIATTYKFVEVINRLMNDCDNINICFDINKRGGTPMYKYSYYIDDFAQLVEAYMIQKPGSARSSKGILINTKEIKGEYEFTRKDIFKNLKVLNDIKKYYSPINYAYELYISYKTHPKAMSDKGDLKEMILKYGNMYCIASVVYCINEKNTDDFSDFEYIDLKYNSRIIDKFIECLEQFLISEKKKDLDSNDFKTEVLYESFKNSDYMNELYQYINNIKKT